MSIAAIQADKFVYRGVNSLSAAPRLVVCCSHFQKGEIQGIMRAIIPITSAVTLRLNSVDRDIKDMDSRMPSKSWIREGDSSNPFYTILLWEHLLGMRQ